jgi:hypothetical protein
MLDVTLGSVVDGVKSVGFPIMVAIGALYIAWKLGTRALDKAEARLDLKEKECADERAAFGAKLDLKSEAHAAERKADREAHLALLSDMKGALAQHGQTLTVVGENVRELVRRRVGGE